MPCSLDTSQETNEKWASGNSLQRIRGLVDTIYIPEKDSKFQLIS